MLCGIVLTPLVAMRGEAQKRDCELVECHTSGDAQREELRCEKLIICNAYFENDAEEALTELTKRATTQGCVSLGSGVESSCIAFRNSSRYLPKRIHFKSVDRVQVIPPG